MMMMMMIMMMMMMMVMVMMMIIIIKHRTRDYLPLDVVDSSGPSNKKIIFKKSIDKEDNRNNENRKENCSELFKFILSRKMMLGGRTSVRSLPTEMFVE